MLKITKSSIFKKDLKRAKKQGLDLSLLENAISILASGNKLPDIYLDHQLSGTLKNFRECHIKPDWLLVYLINDKELELFLFRTGTHSQIFK